jgi:2-amino-4-hydroxy-6-hydroxymethyldihydropteridine diphosphokinase
MRFEEWEPIYARILTDFGFSRSEDERSATILSDLLSGKDLCDEGCISERIAEEVTICGDAVTLEDHLRSIGLSGTVISADGATKALMNAGMRPDIIVTDLDGDIGAQLEAVRLGAVVVIHAHGDNIEALRNHVPRFKGRVMATTQSKPLDPLHNFGGFTDGDRAVLLARHFGAKRLRLLGFDFKEPREKEGRERAVKVRKLEWARALIFDLNPPGVCLSIP